MNFTAKDAQAAAIRRILEQSLQLVFASSNAPGRWLVQSWDWTGH